MTGRFKATWADFGGLKLPNQLLTEVASIVANGAGCDIGDQMPPSGRLDPAVYHVIGKAYSHIKAIEPYLNGAAPMAEAALLVSGLPLEGPNTEAQMGLVKLLMETRVQFDCVEPDAQWERYALVILPETLVVPPAMADRLQRYAAAGGAVIVCDRSGVLSGTEDSWLMKYGMEFAGQSPFRPAYMVPKQEFTGDIPAYEYALYQGASRWRVQQPGEVIAQLGAPAFQRSAEKYTSHRQSPFDHETAFAAIARSGNVALFAFPLGTGYFYEGYWVLRYALAHVLKQLLPNQLVVSNAPVSTELEVTRQKGRYLVHIVNWSANRGTPKHPEFYEEPIPLSNIDVCLRVSMNVKAARTAIGNQKLKVKRNGSGVQVTVPRVDIHEIVCFEEV
jgi:hypothetical protein